MEVDVVIIIMLSFIAFMEILNAVKWSKVEKLLQDKEKRGDCDIPIDILNRIEFLEGELEDAYHRNAKLAESIVSAFAIGLEEEGAENAE
jgi:hypothetical protein